MTFELTPKERVNINSKRLINLRHGAGNYSAEQRVLDIKRTESALQRAFADQRRTK